MEDKIIYQKILAGELTEQDFMVPKYLLETKWDYQKFLWERFGFKSGNKDFDQILEKPFQPIWEEEDIKKAKDKLDLDFVWVKNNLNLKPRKLIGLGFVPLCHLVFSQFNNILEKWFLGMSKDELSWWFDSAQMNILTWFLKGAPDHQKDITDILKYWIYPTKQFIVDHALRKASSFYLLMLYPELIYSKSQRPRTNMDCFKVPDQLVLRLKPESKVFWMEEEWLTLPVTRYAEGMTRSLFYKGESNFCGTFYYLEEESETYLLYQKALTAKNKIKAFKKLIDGLTLKERAEWRKEIDQMITYVDNNEITKKYYDGYFPDDLIMTKSDWLEEDQPGERGYLKYWGEEFYALEDFLDQPICNLAKKAGYDIVIFKKMVGSHQILTEIMDVRVRGDSFRHLAFING